jgi:hypothetical protein
MEYVPLGLNDKTSFTLEKKQTIYFTRMAIIRLKAMLFQPPNSIVKCFTIFTIQISLIKKAQAVDRTGT